MKAIQYREDGKFYGLVNVPEKSKVCECMGCKLNYLELPDVKNSIAAGKEIINPEVLPIRHRNDPRPFNYWVHIDSIALIKPGDIFDCPDNIEFEEEQMFFDELGGCNRWSGIRLFLEKSICDDTWYCITAIVNDGVCGECGLPKQPKPSLETQDELWKEVAITFMNKYSKPAIEENKSKFTVTRK